jgi:hypothetical protein
LSREATGSRAHGLIDILVEVECGEHDDARARDGIGEQALGRLDPVDAWHADVHEHDVWLEASREVDHLEPVRGLADHLDVVLSLEDHAKAASHEPLVVGDEEPDQDCRRSNGRLAWSA